MKTNNIASYTDILEACMRQNPKWILLSEVRSAEAVLAVRNSISSGHYILSTIHADKAASIPNRLYSLLETNQDLEQFMSSICRYIQLGIYIRGYTDKETHNFKREIAEVTEFYVTNDTNKAGHNIIYRKGADGKIIRNNPSPYLIDYLEVQGVFLPKELQNMSDGNSEVNRIQGSQSVKPNVVNTPEINQTTQAVKPNVVNTPVVNQATQDVKPNVVNTPEVNQTTQAVKPNVVNTPVVSQTLQDANQTNINSE